MIEKNNLALIQAKNETKFLNNIRKNKLIDLSLLDQIFFAQGCKILMINKSK